MRPGTVADLDTVVAIYNHYVRHSSATFEVEPVRVEDRVPWAREHLAGGRYRLFVAEERSEVIGWATTSPFRPRAAYATTVESSVYLAPGRLGRGIGSALYRAVLEAVAGEDVERVVAGVTTPNPASVRLHRRFGFRRVGTFHRVGRKFGRYWDVTWFERAIRLPAEDGAVEPGARPWARPPRSGSEGPNSVSRRALLPVPRGR